MAFFSDTVGSPDYGPYAMSVYTEIAPPIIVLHGRIIMQVIINASGTQTDECYPLAISVLVLCFSCGRKGGELHDLFIELIRDWKYYFSGFYVVL